jgi:protein transport protein SEC24
MFRPPQPPTYLFLIDVSYYAVSTGIVKLAAEMVKQCLDRLPGEGRTKVGVITFDSKLHFYDLSQPRPHMQVCCEVSDVYVPPGQVRSFFLARAFGLPPSWILTRDLLR